MGHCFGVMNTPLPPEAIREFQVAYKEAFGTDMPYAEAEAMGTRLVDFVFFIAEILARKDETGEKTPKQTPSPWFDPTGVSTIPESTKSTSPEQQSLF